MFGNVLVKQLEERAAVSSSGLILNVGGRSWKRPDNGVVIAVSRKVERDGSLAVGEKVFFGKFAGVTVKWGGEELLLFSAKELLGTFEGDGIEVVKTHDMDGDMRNMENFVNRTMDKSVRLT